MNLICLLINRVEIFIKKYSEQLIEDISNNTYKHENFDLSCNRLNDNHAINLANALKKNNFIKNVFLGDNKIGDEGIKALASVECLKTLCVNNNNFGSEGVQALAKSKLQELNISNNKIQDSISYFSENTTLSELDANGCGITDEGAVLLAKGKCKLEVLYLEHNKICDEGVNALIQIKTLATLNVSFNFITDKRSFNGATHIKELYTRNNPCHRENRRQTNFTNALASQSIFDFSLNKMQETKKENREIADHSNSP